MAHALFSQYVLKAQLNASMGELMARNLHVSPLNKTVMVLLIVLEEKMNWITTVPVDLREQFV